MSDRLILLLRAALSEAVRSGRTEVAQELTGIVTREIQKRPQIVDTGGAEHGPLAAVPDVKAGQGE